ncbi:hypothetical protein ABT075_44680 [Streptomyces sp. NPDC002677]|uniref:hypothetical protein n=1 Tax=Streptomyces sp. NPDC002677 TaxID=3154774 RepID=UPI00332EF6D0
MTVDFPETHIRVRLRPLDPDTRVDDGLVLEFSAEYRTDDGLRQGQPHSWRRVFTGRPGAFDQGEALLREIAAARSRASGRRVVRPVPVRPELASLRLLAAAV